MFRDGRLLFLFFPLFFFRTVTVPAVPASKRGGERWTDGPYGPHSEDALHLLASLCPGSHAALRRHYSSRKGLSIRIDPLHRFSPSSAEWRNNKAGGDGTVVRERGCEIRENIEWSNVKNHLWNIPRIYFGKLKSRRCIITTGCCKINFHVAVINAIDIHCFGEQWIVRLSRGYDGALCRSFIHSFDQWHTMLRYDKRNYGEIIRTSNAFIRLIGLSWLFHFNFIIEI